MAAAVGEGGVILVASFCHTIIYTVQKKSMKIYKWADAVMFTCCDNQCANGIDSTSGVWRYF